jgi:hypothetical protein
MDDLKFKAAVRESKYVTAAALLLEAQDQVKTAMEEACIARDFLRDIIVTNATEITEDAAETTEDESEKTKRTWSKMKKYYSTKLIQNLNSFCKGRGKWVQHATYIFEHGSFALSFDWFCDSAFTRDFVYEKKWAHAVVMNHGLNLGGIEVIRTTEGTKKGAMRLV